MGSSKPVICYDQSNNINASRAAFVLKTYGFKDVKVLNGGLKAWGDRATEAGEVKYADDSLILNFSDQDLVSYEQILDLMGGTG